jgi:hypothetical protein
MMDSNPIPTRRRELLRVEGSTGQSPTLAHQGKDISRQIKIISATAICTYLSGHTIKARAHTHTPFHTESIAEQSQYPIQSGKSSPSEPIFQESRKKKKKKRKETMKSSEHTPNKPKNSKRKEKKKKKKIPRFNWNKKNATLIAKKNADHGKNKRKKPPGEKKKTKPVKKNPASTSLSYGHKQQEPAN